MSEISSLLTGEEYSFISRDDKAFIAAFDDEMMKLGYGCGGKAGSGYCWGRYMLIYTKLGVKSKQVYSRVYIREHGITLRFFLNELDKHRQYLEKAPTHIKDVFTGSHGDCEHCHNEKDGKCRFRKAYTLENRFIEKCNGITFEFQDPIVGKIPEYISLFTEFYPGKMPRVTAKSSISLTALV